jgi:hypothetical protein
MSILQNIKYPISDITDKQQIGILPSKTVDEWLHMCRAWVYMQSGCIDVLDVEHDIESCDSWIRHYLNMASKIGTNVEENIAETKVIFAKFLEHVIFNLDEVQE